VEFHRVPFHAGSTTSCSDVLVPPHSAFGPFFPG
jgi:hypothetical protein